MLATYLADKWQFFEEKERKKSCITFIIITFLRCMTSTFFFYFYTLWASGRTLGLTRWLHGIFITFNTFYVGKLTFQNYSMSQFLQNTTFLYNLCYNPLLIYFIIEGHLVIIFNENENIDFLMVFLIFYIFISNNFQLYKNNNKMYNTLEWIHFCNY